MSCLWSRLTKAPHQEQPQEQPQAVQSPPARTPSLSPPPPQQQQQQQATPPAVAADEDALPPPTPQAVAPRRMSWQAPQLHDWQPRVRWEFKSPDDIPEGAEHAVFAVAGNFRAYRWGCLVLPSGKVLERVVRSVLRRYCRTLQSHASDVLEKMLWPTYLGAADCWCDDTVETFFAMLHRDQLHNRYIDKSATMLPTYGALIDAFQVDAAKEAYKVYCEYVIGGRVALATAGRDLFVWLDGYQLLNPDWKTDALALLAQLPPEQLSLWVDGENRRRLQEAFTIDDIVALACSRWTGRPQESSRPAPAPAGPTRPSVPAGEVVLTGASELQLSMQLRVVISDDFSIICNREVARQRSPFIQEAPLDNSDDGCIATIYLPDASSLPRDEVLEFFTKVDEIHRFSAGCDWKPSWVQLADYLLMADVLDAAAKWVWHPARAGTFTDWHPVANLQSMQQRRPVDVTGYWRLATEELLPTLKLAQARDVKVNMLAAAIARYGMELLELMGTDAFLDLLTIGPLRLL